MYQDILQVDFKEYDFSKYDNVHIIANIPYYITTPIIEKIINSNINEVDMTLMVQKEVADRFSAKPGYYRGIFIGFCLVILICK